MIPPFCWQWQGAGGGWLRCDGKLASAELYDPANRSLAPTVVSLRNVLDHRLPCCLTEGSVARGAGNERRTHERGTLRIRRKALGRAQGASTLVAASTTLTLLKNGKVLASGGLDSNGEVDHRRGSFIIQPLAPGREQGNWSNPTLFTRRRCSTTEKCCSLEAVVSRLWECCGDLRPI